MPASARKVSNTAPAWVGDIVAPDGGVVAKALEHDAALTVVVNYTL